MKSRATQADVPEVIVYSGRAMWNADAGPIKSGMPPQPPPSVRSIIAELRDAFFRARDAGCVPKYRGVFEFMAHVAPELLEQETRRRHDVRQTEEHLKHCAKLKDVLLRAGLGQDFATSEQVALRALAKRLLEAAYGGPPVSFDEVEAFASHLDDLAVVIRELPIGPRRWNPATDDSDTTTSIPLADTSEPNGVTGEDRRAQSGEGESQGHDTIALTQPGTFYRDGDGWHVGLGGATSVIKNHVGCRYIHMLLSNEGKSVSAPILRNSNQLPILEDRIHHPVHDKRMTAEVRRATKTLRETQAVARAAGETETEARATAALERLQSHTARDLDRNGRPRPLSGLAESDRRSVGAAMAYVLKRLRDIDVNLYRHLKGALKTPSGSSPTYAPEQRVLWRLH